MLFVAAVFPNMTLFLQCDLPPALGFSFLTPFFDLSITASVKDYLVFVKAITEPLSYFWRDLTHKFGILTENGLILHVLATCPFTCNS